MPGCLPADRHACACMRRPDRRTLTPAEPAPQVSVEAGREQQVCSHGERHRREERRLVAGEGDIVHHVGAPATAAFSKCPGLEALVVSADELAVVGVAQERPHRHGMALERQVQVEARPDLQLRHGARSARGTAPRQRRGRCNRDYL
eukprot:214359-Chlamydomonas_euryale.AAC.2